MEIKNNFVTNSSSVSFIVWGINYDIPKLLKIKNVANKIYEMYLNNQKKYKLKALSKEEFIKNDDDGNIEEYIEEYISNCGLDSTFGPDYDNYFIDIGKSPFDMKLDETLLDFKKDIQKRLLKLGIDIPAEEIQQITECWEDR